MAISIDMKLKDLLEIPEAKAIIDEMIPLLTQSSGMQMVIGLKLSKIVKIPYAQMTKEQAQELAARLDALNTSENPES
jgi:hypothetical protein